MSRKGYLLAAFAALLVLGFSISPAMAYFTCYTEAEGVKIVKISEDTTIEEPVVKDWVKHLAIKNTGDGPVFIRATAFAADRFGLSAEGSNWESSTALKSGDFVYYTKALEPGEMADELLIKISNVPEKEALELGDSFNVVVVYEAVPATFNEDRSPKYKDEDVWAQDRVVIKE